MISRRSTPLLGTCTGKSVPSKNPRRGGAGIEPWHLSYAPVSVAAQRAVTPEVLSAALDAEQVLGREVVRSRLAEIHERYVSNVDAP